MGKSAKPRKAYKAKPAVLPFGMRRQDKFEFPGYAASVALGQDFLCEQHIYDLLSNADMTRRIAPDGHEILPIAEAMVQAIATIQRRAEASGKLGVTGDELRVLREGIGRTMDFLRAQSNVAIARASAAATREFDRTGVLRV